MNEDPADVAQRFVQAVLAQPMHRSEALGLLDPKRRIDFADLESIRATLSSIRDLGFTDAVTIDEDDPTLASTLFFEGVDARYTMIDEIPIGDLPVRPAGKVTLRYRPEFGGWLVSGLGPSR